MATGTLEWRVLTTAIQNGYTGAMETTLITNYGLTQAIPIVVDIESGRFSSQVIAGACLYGQQSAYPNKYAPFYVSALIASATTASGQKDIVLAASGTAGNTETIANFIAGDTILITDNNGFETRVIDHVTAATNTISVTVNLTNAYTSATGAKVVLSDGTEDSAKAVLVLDNIDFTTSSWGTGVLKNGVTSGFITAAAHKCRVHRTANFVDADCARLILMDTVGIS